MLLYTFSEIVSSKPQLIAKFVTGLVKHIAIIIPDKALVNFNNVVKKPTLYPINATIINNAINIKQKRYYLYKTISFNSF